MSRNNDLEELFWLERLPGGLTIPLLYGINYRSITQDCPQKESDWRLYGETHYVLILNTHHSVWDI